MNGGSEVLKLAGRALYGERWQVPLARDLGISDRTVRYWVAGNHPRPPDLNQRLVALLRERGEELSGLIALIERNENGKAV
jgi:hypothetical protein